MEWSWGDLDRTTPSRVPGTYPTWSGPVRILTGPLQVGYIAHMPHIAYMTIISMISIILIISIISIISILTPLGVVLQGS